MKFGTLFRQLRKALGFSLREFCRKNNLDAANISRLERGLVRPPQSKAILEVYAKALSISNESTQWHNFFELAALENGMVSPQIQESQIMRDKLPKVLQKLREEVKYPGSWVTALDLEGWTDSYTASFTLPRLIRRLIKTTTKNLARVEFPADEGVRSPGVDGIVEVAEGNAFVPAGISVWEAGTDKKVRQKAESDYIKRTETPPLGLDTRQTTFIFVTPRKFTKRNEWCEEKKKLGRWKDVRVYDSSILEEWLEISTATDVWFAKLIGRRPEGITGIEEHWKNLSMLSKPNFKPEVFLASREKDIKTLKEWLDGSPKPLTFEAHSPSEVIDFVSAYIASLSEGDREFIETRTVIVEDHAAWKILCSSNSKFVLIQKPSLDLEPEMISGAEREGHHVLLSFPKIGNNEANKLSRVYDQDLEKALIASGFEEIDARNLAQKSGGSLTILKRRLPGFSRISCPAWSKPPDAESLLPIILIGRWDDSSIADQKAIATLGDDSYSKILAIANRYRTGNDPVIMRVHSSWSLISREDSWELLAPKFSAPQLDCFEKIAFEVLSEEDPCYDLPAKERWYAALRNKSPKFSSHLKKGIAETIALLGAGNANVVNTPINASHRAARVVQKLLLGADWKRWASLKSYLPLLAEASPEMFIEAAEKDLSSHKPQLPLLFIEGDSSGFMPDCNDTGLLWALETLAWSPEYLSRVTVLLAQFDQIDPPESKWGNRPKNSLGEIFLPWLPHTTATVDQRIEVLEKLCDEIPKVGFKLLLELLPQAHSSSMNTHRPSWRKWALGWSSRITNGEYWKQSEWCAEKLVQNLDQDGDLWESVVDRMEKLPKKSFDLFIQRLQTIALDKLPEKTREQIFKALLDRINRHRRFADAEWAMPKETLDMLESIKSRFEPTDLVNKYKWLFVNFLELPDEGQSIEQKNEILFEKRLSVLKEFIEKKGIKSLSEFALAVDHPYLIGHILGQSNLLENDDHFLPKMLADKDHKIANLAAGYVWARFYTVGWVWIEQLSFKKWTIEQMGNLLLVLPFERKTWSLVESLGKEVIVYYWSARHFDVYRGKDPDELEYVVSMLLLNLRAFRAIDIICMALHNKCKVNTTLVMEALEGTLKLSEQAAKEQITNDKSYNLLELFKFLQGQEDVDRERLASLEWSYLSLLDGYHGGEPITLHQSIQTDPKVFVKIISIVFKSKNEPQKTTLTEQQRAAALNAYQLLESLKSIPGSQGDGSVDGKKVHRLGDRSKVFMQGIRAA